MFELICVTNRNLCTEHIEKRIEKLCMSGIDRIILREKDLSVEQYKQLAQRVIAVTEKYNVILTLHKFYDAAIQFGIKSVHLPIGFLREMSLEKKEFFDEIGSSVHSVEQAEEALSLGCTYLTAGHIFATDCKKGLAPRGISFLNEICDMSEIPVYAIGGINKDNINEIKDICSGACIMSGFMKCVDTEKYMKGLRNDIR